MSFHLFMSSLISFISILQFSEYRSFVPLGRFIPRYFILFDAMINVMVSLISLSDLSLLTYRNAINFCVLILYPETLPNSLISSNSFLVASLGFSRYSIMSSANSDGFTSSFSICIPLIYFSSLIAMAKTSKTLIVVSILTMNRSGESRHPCLVPILSGNSLSFSPWRMMSAVGFSYRPLLC
uniref:Uncharacterized protein n=1 Tax=Sus scrofa TaxID=9823 RepID=A0A8D0VEL9_PIG